MTNPDYRAMCAELVEAMTDDSTGCWQREADVIERARALLAEPEAEGPSASDVTELFYRHMGEGSEVGFENAIAEALSRWGRPAAEAVFTAILNLKDNVNPRHRIAAAALRAAADQVVPAEPENEDLDPCNPDDKAEWAQYSQRQHTRSQLLLIAAELEAQSCPPTVRPRPTHPRGQ